MKSRGLLIALLNLPMLLAAAGAAVFYRSERASGTLVSSGERRSYVLYVPATYDKTKPTPLVISLHGAALWGAAQRDISEWNRVADREGFIVVYPTALEGNGPAIWRASPSQVHLDVRFIADLIDTLAASYNIDRTRVYANGLSNGGGMSFALSCTMPDRIAAVGLVGAAQTMPWRWCTDRHSVPMIAFHGTADKHVPYDGGASWATMSAFPNVPQWTANWAQRNGCAPTPTDTRVAPDVTRRAYSNCVNGADVLLYTVEGGGHTWPGGGPMPQWFVGRTSRGIDASTVMWEFFKAHPLHTEAADAHR